MREHQDVPPHDSRLAFARSQLEETAWEGQEMPPEQAMKHALSAEEKPPTEAPRPEEPPADGTRQVAALTRREREVAMPIAQGLTNRRVAEELVISERPVATHVRRIPVRLSLRSRVHIAARAMEQELIR